MYLVYSSLIFLSLLGVFLFFVWIVVKTGHQAAYEVAMESTLGEREHPVWRSDNFQNATEKYHPDLASSSHYYSTASNEEEERLMNEIDNIKKEQELKEWFELLKSGYKHKNIPKRVNLRVSTILNGFVWFDAEEYVQRIQEGKPVHKVTEREYALEKKLEGLMASGSNDRK